MVHAVHIFMFIELVVIKHPDTSFTHSQIHTQIHTHTEQEHCTLV